MSPVFRHGGLRLYLLKLLDEAPRHGYDVIRLLQDRFLGVYSPSPGTIYPRLARLEEEGLVTHDVVDGKKIYKITDAGRAELNRRLDDLADLEDELTASVRDIASQISQDVRETVRNLRDELTWAVREAGRAAGTATRRAEEPADADAAAEAGQADRDGDDRDGDRHYGRDEAHDEGRDKGGHDEGGRDEGPDEGADWPDWAHWACRRDWQDWGDWRDWLGRPQDWGWSREWAGFTGRPHKAQWQEAKQRAKAEWREAKQQAKTEWREDNDIVADLERLAALFAREIRGVARHAEGVSEGATASLSRILGDAVTRIKNEVFGAGGPDSGSEDREPDA